MYQNTLRRAPTPPKHFSTEQIDLWREMIQRGVASVGHIYRSDLPLVECYCELYGRWRQVRDEANKTPLTDEAGKLHPIHRYESEIAAQLRSHARAWEATTNTRKRAQGKPGTAGGQPGVRQKPAREGVASNAKGSIGTISWMDDIRKAKD